MSTEFVSDPIVPVELDLGSGRRYVTLYQPGWYTADDGSGAFLGKAQEVYGFRSLVELAAFVGTETDHDLTPSEQFASVRGWRVQEYADRLCEYDLSQIVELADGELDHDEQGALGSVLALLLDMLDYTEIEDEHAEALREDEDISKLASGDELLAVFTAGRHRKHVVELLENHWGPSVSAVANRIRMPEVPNGMPDGGKNGSSSGSADGPALEEVTDAVTLWIGFEKTAIYTVRTTVLDAGLPAYAGRYTKDGDHKLRGWTDPSDIVTAVRAREVDKLGPVDLTRALAGTSGGDVDLRPHDDLIFDLYEIGRSITPAMTAEQAGAMGEAWIELTRMAAWGDWTDVAEQTAPTSVVGAFVLGCVSDVGRGCPGAEQALASAQVDTVRTAWSTLSAAVWGHVSTSK